MGLRIMETPFGRISALALAIGLANCFEEPKPPPGPAKKPMLQEGVWRAVLHSPGGELPFGLKIQQTGEGYAATAHNGNEVVVFDAVTLDEEGNFTMAIDHYESAFHAKLDPSGIAMRGEWQKVAGPGEYSRLPFHAEHGKKARFEFERIEEPVMLEGRWEVTFDNDGGEPQPAVAEFRQMESRLTGTFLTPTGDYRYLEGSVNGNELYLSCFDGGHAFLFEASLDGQGRLHGDFWSRDTWHETWSAVRNEHAELEDAYALTSLKEGVTEFRFSFPDLEGNLVRHDDPWLKDKVRLITIFGSWCPNCNDEAPFLEELYQSYKDRGFEVVGLAFEMTGNLQRDTRVLNRFRKRHDLSYRILLAGGTKDKKEVAKILPDLNHVLSYPTNILIDRDGRVAHIHTGFTGPGTGRHYEELKRDTRQRIEALLR